MRTTIVQPTFEFDQLSKMSYKPTAADGRTVKLIGVFLVLLLLFEIGLPLIEAGEKGRDIIIYDGKVIVKGGKKKGNIIISNGSHGQGKYKYKKKYMDYGGYWKRR